jgi:peptide/nickel transport system substrate-binding protein
VDAHVAILIRLPFEDAGNGVNWFSLPHKVNGVYEMKRFLLVFAFLVSVFGLTLANVSAQEAPEGVWLGTWPYVLPPDHHLNAYAEGGPSTNLGNVYREMVELAPAFYMWADNTYEPLLAESWGFTEDNAAYEITLQDGLTWSNDSAITADDIVTTYALGRLVGWTQFSYIDEVEKVDDLTVRFHFSGEPSLLAEQLLLREPIVANDTYGEYAEQALALFETDATNESEEWTTLLDDLRAYRPEEYIASGPYTYSLEDVGDSFMTLHWQPNSIFSDTVQFGELKLWAGETVSTTPLVLSGEIAHATNVYPPATVESFVAQGLEIVTIPRGYGPAMLFNYNVAPWNIPEVRQAAALVIDRDQNAFLTNGLGGTGTVYMAGILDGNVESLLNQDVIDQLDRYAYDPERAAGLLESVGYTQNADGIWADADGNTLSGEWIFPSDFVDFSAATQDAVAQLNAFGFDIEARALPSAEVPPLIREGSFELSIWSWGAASPFASRHFANPLQRWTTDLDPDLPGIGLPMMEYPYNGETLNLDTMIDEVSTGLDTEAQKERAGEVALIVNQTMPYIPLNVILSAEPFNTSIISGLPSPDDPIMLNPTGRDHFIKYTIWTGVLGPAA